MEGYCELDGANAGSESGGRSRGRSKYAAGLLTVSTKWKPECLVNNGHQEADAPFSPVHVSLVIRLPQDYPITAPELPHDCSTAAPLLPHNCHDA